MIGLIERNILGVLSVFSTSPGSRLRRNQIKELTGIPNVVLDKNLAKLFNLKILVKKKGLISLNLANDEIKKIIKVLMENYDKFKYLPLREYFMIVHIIDEILVVRGIEEMYLFGSYSKLTFNQKSDVDFAIISDDVNKKKIAGIIKKLEKRYKKKIEIHYFSRDFYKNKRDSLVKDILRNGVKVV